MHSNAIVIERLFTSLDRHDPRALADCYDDNATFHDIAFDLKGKEEILSMWRMITSGDIRTTIEQIDADDCMGSARVVDEYTFRETGRPVRNVIESHFRFRDGRILDHRDTCDPRAWGAMALGGMPGFLAGRLRFIRKWAARRTLSDFSRHHTV